MNYQSILEDLQAQEQITVEDVKKLADFQQEAARIIYKKVKKGSKPFAAFHKLKKLKFNNESTARLFLLTESEEDKVVKKPNNHIFNNYHKDAKTEERSEGKENGEARGAKKHKNGKPNNHIFGKSTEARVKAQEERKPLEERVVNNHIFKAPQPKPVEPVKPKKEKEEAKLILADNVAPIVDDIKKHQEEEKQQAAELEKLEQEALSVARAEATKEKTAKSEELKAEELAAKISKTIAEEEKEVIDKLNLSNALKNESSDYVNSGIQEEENVIDSSEVSDEAKEFIKELTEGAGTTIEDIENIKPEIPAGAIVGAKEILKQKAAARAAEIRAELAELEEGLKVLRKERKAQNTKAKASEEGLKLKARIDKAVKAQKYLKSKLDQLV
jgi:hypothetical protein